MVTSGLDRWSPPHHNTVEYRTRLTGLLEPEAALAEAIAASLYTYLVHSRPPGVHYTIPGMADPFEAYHKELRQSDRNPTTIERYWQIVSSYREWLGDRQPDAATAKEFLAHLRDKGYAHNAVLLYYHALRLFFGFLGEPLKLKVRKFKLLPRYYDRGDIEALIAQAAKGIYNQTEKQKQRNEALILTLAYTGMRRAEVLKLLVGDDTSSTISEIHYTTGVPQFVGIAAF